MQVCLHSARKLQTSEPKQQASKQSRAPTRSILRANYAIMVGRWKTILGFNGRIITPTRILHTYNNTCLHACIVVLNSNAINTVECRVIIAAVFSIPQLDWMIITRMFYRSQWHTVTTGYAHISKYNIIGHRSERQNSTALYSKYASQLRTICVRFIGARNLSILYIKVLRWTSRLLTFSCGINTATIDMVQKHISTHIRIHSECGSGT